MNFKFICGLCKKEVKRGKKFRVEADCYKDDIHLNGEFEEDNICKQCTIRIQGKINSLRK